MDRLKGKTAIVTGGSSGIGKAIVELFLEEGATVAVFDIRDPGNEQTDKYSFYTVDISKESVVKEAMAKVYEKYGRIDILVNNAGIPGANKPTHATEEKEWDEVFDIDVKGTFFATKHVIPYMLKDGGGSIVNLSSVCATCGSKGTIAAYHGAKGAIAAMTRQDAATYGRKNIRVNAVLPGTIDTPLMHGLSEVLEGGFDTYAAYIAKHHALGHVGEPKDVAYGVLYLASDEAKFVTGTSLFVDGGYSCW